LSYIERFFVIHWTQNVCGVIYRLKRHFLFWHLKNGFKWTLSRFKSIAIFQQATNERWGVFLKQPMKTWNIWTSRVSIKMSLMLIISYPIFSTLIICKILLECQENYKTTWSTFLLNLLRTSSNFLIIWPFKRVRLEKGSILGVATLE